MEDTTNTTKKECCRDAQSCRRSCCGSRAVAAIILVLIGGILGYLIGSPTGYFHRFGYGHYPCPAPTVEMPDRSQR